jgi:hypothetical protein
MNRCAILGVVKSVSDAHLYCDFIQKYIVHDNYQEGSPIRDTVFLFLLDNFEKFPANNYPFTRTLSIALSAEKIRCVHHPGKIIDRIIKFLSPRASLFIAHDEAGADCIQLLTRVSYLRWSDSMFDFLKDKLPDTLYSACRFDKISLFVRALSFKRFDRRSFIAALKDLTLFNIEEYSTSDLNSMLWRYKQDVLPIEFIMYYLERHKRRVDWTNIAGTSEFGHFLVQLFYTKRLFPLILERVGGQPLYYDSIVEQALQSPQIIELCVRGGGFFKQLDEYMSEFGLDILGWKTPLHGLIYEENDEVFCNLAQCEIWARPTSLFDAPKLFNRLSRLVDEGRNVDNLIKHFLPSISKSDYKQVLSSIGGKLGSKIMTDYFNLTPKYACDLMNEDIEWLRPSPTDSPCLSLKKQLLIDSANLSLNESVMYSLIEQDRDLAKVLNSKKLENCVHEIRRNFRNCYSDGPSPVLVYISTLTGHSKLQIEETDLSLRHMFLYRQCLKYSSSDCRSIYSNHNTTFKSVERYERQTLFSESNNLVMFPPGMLYLEEQIMAHSLAYLRLHTDQPSWPEWYLRAFSYLVERLLLNLSIFNR